MSTLPTRAAPGEPRCHGAGGACVMRAETVRVDHDGPHLACPAHGGGTDWARGTDLPADLGRDLLAAWVQAEREEQRRLARSLRETQALPARLPARLRDAEARRDGQPALSLET